jgi:hypothetical protein
MLVLTDERLAERISEHVDTLAKLVPAGTLAHVVVVTGGSGTVERDDLAVLAPFANQTGGIAAQVGLGEHGELDVRSLVQPVTVDHMKIAGAGWKTAVPEQTTCELDDTAMDAGRSCTWWAEGTPAAGAVTLTGQLWGRTFQRTFVPDAGQALAVARMLSAIGGLAPDIQAQIDLAACAVNGVWSLFATWGGSGGYGETELTADVEGGISIGGIGTSSVDTVDTVGFARSQAPELTLELQGAVARCKPPATVVVRVETTFDEIVDVDVVTPDLGPIESCIREAIWDTSLVLHHPLDHANARLTFQRS